MGGTLAVLSASGKLLADMKDLSKIPEDVLNHYHEF